MPKKTEAQKLEYDLRKFRLDLNQSQAEFADLFGVSLSQIWRMEKAKQVTKLMSWACYGLSKWFEAKRKGE